MKPEAPLHFLDMEVIPTIVPTNFDDLAAKISVVRGFSRIVHIDAADGRFAPNTTWLPQTGERIPGLNALLVEAHLMVENPLEIGIAFAMAGASRLIAHREAFADTASIISTFDAWKREGVREVGLALRIDTDPLTIADVVARCDSVTLMSIAHIGQQGASFEASSIPRVATFHAQFPELLLAVDGGVSEANIQALSEAGAQRFCVGSALAAASDPAAVYKQLRGLVEAV